MVKATQGNYPIWVYIKCLPVFNNKEVWWKFNATNDVIVWFPCTQKVTVQHVVCNLPLHVEVGLCMRCPFATATAKVAQDMPRPKTRRQKWRLSWNSIPIRAAWPFIEWEDNKCSEILHRFIGSLSRSFNVFMIFFCIPGGCRISEPTAVVSGDLVEGWYLLGLWVTYWFTNRIQKNLSLETCFPLPLCFAFQSLRNPTDVLGLVTLAGSSFLMLSQNE